MIIITEGLHRPCEKFQDPSEKKPSYTLSLFYNIGLTYLQDTLRWKGDCTQPAG